jgi:copper homeostasis protein
MQLEVCIETLQEAKLAEQYKCNRIEVCSALDLGGLTPSYGLIHACTNLQNIDSHILIRPRAGNFVYSNSELILIKEDIKIAAEAGAKGVVFGCLDSNNNVDSKSCELLLQFAKGHQLQTTFHRAVDFTKNYQKAIQIIIDLGFDRILTSGQEETALKGIHTIQSAINVYSKQIEIMAGSGINAKNVSFFKETGLAAIHFSIRKKNKTQSELDMGTYNQPDEEKLKQIIQKINT